jgi:hypothetical protein
MHKGTFGLGALLLAGFTTPSPAQGARLVDGGSFSITVNGQRAGREDFTISATPRGQMVEHIAQATVTFGDRRLSPSLIADSSGVPLSYKITTRSTSGGPESWQGTIVRGKVSARIETPRGPAAREFIVTEGALILDDDVFHQYYFLAQRRANGTLTVVVPHRNAQLRLQISTAGDERVQIGTQEIDARHLVLTEPSGAQREVWVDKQGRVLRVAIPAQGIVAVRDDPPRP